MSMILVADDEQNMRYTLKKALESEGYSVMLAANGAQAWDFVQKNDISLLILDHKMPIMGGLEVLERLSKTRIPTKVVMLTAFGSMDNALTALKAGADEYLTKPFELDELITIVERLLHQDQIDETEKIEDINEQYSLIGESPAMVEVARLIHRVAQSDASVLITGETGTGKEMVAKAIHHQSPRSKHPFIAVNCAALPETLLESELFGYEKGAFTGASKMKKGRFELAHNGTIFLDEIGDLPASFQVKLLRVLQERSIERVGSTKSIDVNVRLVSATHRNLLEAIDIGDFREDLFYRLNVIEIQLPPLKNRGQDVILLAEYFLRLFGQERGLQFELADYAKEELLSYSWPGNVRELKNVIERAVIISNQRLIPALNLGRNQIAKQQASFDLGRLDDLMIPAAGIKLDELERTLIIKALEQTEGNQTQAAQLLGVSRPTLIYRMKKYDIEGGV